MSDEKEEGLGAARFPGPDSLPDELPPMTAKECEQWARLNYRPGYHPISDSWWDDVRATCEAMNREHLWRGYKKDYARPSPARKIWDNKPLRRRWGLALGAVLIVFGGTALIFTDAIYRFFGMVVLALGGGLAVFSLPKTDEDK